MQTWKPRKSGTASDHASCHPTFKDRALRKLRELAAAPTLETLRFPPSNRLHPLLGDRKDSHAIRINDQWRLTFTWGSQGPENVCIEDYQ